MKVFVPLIHFHWFFFFYLNFLFYHSWQRGPKPPYFMKTPLYCLPVFFKFCPPPPPPCCLQPHPHCSFCCLVSLAEWVIAPHLRCAILLNDIMDVHMWTLWTLMYVLCNKASGFIVCIGVSTPLQKHHPLFFAKPNPLLNLQTVQAPLFRQFPPYKLVFREPPPKNGIF